MAPGSASAAGIGTLDTSFGGSGTVVTPLTGSFNDVVVDGAGNTYAVGTSGGDVVVAKYLPNGTLDPNFDGGTTGNGVITFSIGPNPDAATAVALKGTNLIVAGTTNQGGPINSWIRSMDRTTGGWDAAFGGGSAILINHQAGNDIIEDLVVDGGGKVIYIGSTSTGGADDLLIGRRDASGGPDNSTFNSPNGWRAVDNLGVDKGFAVAQRPDGRFYVAGTTNAGSNADLLVAAFNPNGSDETIWGLGGRFERELTAGQNDVAHAIFYHDPTSTFAVAGASHNDTAVVRLQTDGNPLWSFEGTGEKVLNLSPNAGPDEAHSVFVQDGTGNVVIAGTATTATDAAFYSGRLLSGGGNDFSWNSTGHTLTPFTPSTFSHAAALGTGVFPTVTVVGMANSQLGVARYSTQPPSVTISLPSCGDAQNEMILTAGETKVSPDDCSVSMVTDSDDGMSLRVSQANLDGDGRALSGAVVDIPDYSTNWFGGPAFGICLRAVSGGVNANGMTLPIGPNCSTTESATWRGIPVTPMTVASSSGPLVAGGAHFRFATRIEPTTPAGSYNAQLVFTAVAPA